MKLKQEDRQKALVNFQLSEKLSIFCLPSRDLKYLFLYSNSRRVTEEG